jgi:hypothetical protein
VPRPNEVVTVSVRVDHVNPKSVRVTVEGRNEPVYLPVSQIEDPEPDDLVVGEMNDITIPKWLADNEGL